MIGPWIGRILGFGGEVAADAVIIKGVPALWGWLKKNSGNLPPEMKEEAKKLLLKISADGRGRGDELVFLVSLVTLPGVSEQNKVLFWKIHYQLTNPDFSGKTPDEIKDLRKKEKLAKGLIFLIATDPTVAEIDPKKRFLLAKEIWYSIFLGLGDPADPAELEKRILQFGKNHQERMTLEEFSEKAFPILGKADSVIASGIDSVSRRITSQWDKIDAERTALKNLPWKGNATKKIWGWWNDC